MIKESLMKDKWKQITLAALGGALAIAVAFGVASTTFAQDPGAEQQPNAGVTRPGGFDERMGGHGPGGWGVHGASLATIAKTLGMSETELRTTLQSGQSVAGVAKAQEVELDVVVQALVAEQRQLLAQAVTAGRLTQAQADEMLASYTEKLPAMLERSDLPAGPGHGSGPRRGMERGWGGPGRLQPPAGSSSEQPTQPGSPLVAPEDAQNA
jgi:hypothetical protein